MTHRTVILFVKVFMLRLSAVLVVLASFSASASPHEKTLSSVRAFVGVSGGIGAVTSRHPLLNGLFAAPGFAINAGVEFRKVFIFGAEVGSVSKYVAKTNDGRGVYEAAAGAGCNNCETLTGGELAAGTVTWPSVGPRIDFAPLGQTSPFVSVSGGFVFVQGVLPTQSGGYVTGRVGFRYAIAEHVEADAEAGYQAEWLANATLKNVFGNLMIRAYF